jgi:hypothetical protein
MLWSNEKTGVRRLNNQKQWTIVKKSQKRLQVKFVSESCTEDSEDSSRIPEEFSVLSA